MFSRLSSNRKASSVWSDDRESPENRWKFKSPLQILNEEADEGSFYENRKPWRWLFTPQDEWHSSWVLALSERRNQVSWNSSEKRLQSNQNFWKGK